MGKMDQELLLTQPLKFRDVPENTCVKHLCPTISQQRTTVYTCSVSLDLVNKFENMLSYEYY